MIEEFPIKKNKQITFQLSEKMLNDFNEKCKEQEVTKSEVLRDFIRKFIEKSK